MGEEAAFSRSWLRSRMEERTAADGPDGYRQEFRSLYSDGVCPANFLKAVLKTDFE